LQLGDDVADGDPDWVREHAWIVAHGATLGASAEPQGAAPHRSENKPVEREYANVAAVADGGERGVYVDDRTTTRRGQVRTISGRDTIAKLVDDLLSDATPEDGKASEGHAQPVGRGCKAGKGRCEPVDHMLSVAV